MSRDAFRVVLGVVLVTGTFFAGTAVGLFFFPRWNNAADSGDGHGHGHDGSESDAAAASEFLELTAQAVGNLELKIGPVTRGEYWKTRAVPGEVVEIPGKSDLSASAPVTGVVEQIFVREGQALAADDRLLTIRIMDENLTTAQASLLTTLARQDVVQQEIQRLAPLTESGAVSGRRQRDLEYELTQLQSEQQTRIQEIRARGLPETALKEIVETRSLASSLTIAVPNFVDRAESALTLPVAVDPPVKQGNYSVERLNVHPGQTVQRGHTLCNLAYHAELYIQGQAFETDLEALSRVAREDWRVTAEFGHQHQAGHAHTVLREQLKLLHIDNHVDRETQTFKFFLPLINDVTRTIVDDLGRPFQQWQFKPGQRVHLSLPVERWEDQITVPLDAVVIEGPNAYMFVEHQHDATHEADQHDDDHDHAHAAEEQPAHAHHQDHAHDHDDTHDHDHHAEHGDDHAHEDHGHGHDDHGPDEHGHAHGHKQADQVFLELKRVSVRLLHRDNVVAVIADDGQIAGGQRVALNAAYKLHLALNLQNSTGGGGHHGHDH